jgi:hypothetical protein
MGVPDRPDGEASYAAASGLIGRFASAYCCAVPADPRDDGFFGPASVTWQVSADLSAPAAGPRAADAGIAPAGDGRRRPA